jgi:hypothetical protein
MDDKVGIGLFVLNMVSCVLVARLAARWGHNFWLYFFGSLLFSPVYGLIRLWIHGKAEDD